MTVQYKYKKRILSILLNSYPKSVKNGTIIYEILFVSKLIFFTNIHLDQGLCEHSNAKYANAVVANASYFNITVNMQHSCMVIVEFVQIFKYRI